MPTRSFHDEQRAPARPRNLQAGARAHFIRLARSAGLCHATGGDLQLHTIWQHIGPILPGLRGSLLDVGCGEMPFRFALDPAVRYTGIDVEQATAFGMSDDDAIRTFDGTTIPFSDNAFNAVLCTEVLEHAVDPVRLAAEMLRVLKPGGMLILTVPYSARVHHAPWDFTRFTRYGLERLLADFGTCTVRPRGNDVAAIASKLVVLALRLLRPGVRHAKDWPLGLLAALLAGMFLPIAHLASMLDTGGTDDPLGYAVIATK